MFVQVNAPRTLRLLPRSVAVIVSGRDNVWKSPCHRWLANSSGTEEPVPANNNDKKPTNELNHPHTDGDVITSHSGSMRHRSSSHSDTSLSMSHSTSSLAPPVIPGAHQYGSLVDPMHRNHVTARDATAWQPADNVDVQNVTRKAYIYELIHQQTQTIEATVPWFLDNMPASYFKQVPERFRMDHIKAIAAFKDANMDLYLNLQSHLADGRQVLTFIRPGTAAGTLLQMVQELPEKYGTDTPLSRLHVFRPKMRHCHGHGRDQRQHHRKSQGTGTVLGRHGGGKFTTSGGLGKFVSLAGCAPF